MIATFGETKSCKFRSTPAIIETLKNKSPEFKKLLSLRGVETFEVWRVNFATRRFGVLSSQSQELEA